MINVRSLRLWIIALTFTLFVVACSDSTPPAVTQAPAPTNTQVAATPTRVPPTATFTPAPSPTITPTRAPTATPTPRPNPLSIEFMRQQEYPGSDITIEQTLPAGSNYRRFVASYKSDGYKIYALLTIPNGTKPTSGWPIIIFNHGYIPPTLYRTTERYVAYVDSFARNGYIVFKSDYRGHGDSEGGASGGYGSPAYTIDILNALTSLKRLPDADPNRIGMWGHSMGGQVTLRAMVITPEIKAGVIWAGVVASYPDLIRSWRNPTGSAAVPPGARGWRQDLIGEYGSPDDNPTFWNSISPNAYLADISGPLQLHHSVADHTVPFPFSETLTKQMQAVGKPVEFYSYPGDDHDIANSFGAAMQRSIIFFDKYVKNRS